MKKLTNQVLLTAFVVCCLNACKGIELSDSSETSDSNNTSITDIDNSINGQDASENGSSPDCDTVQGNDGPGGFLWKASSEGDGNLVVLFPQEFSREFLTVTVELAPEEEEEAVVAEVSKEALEKEFGVFDGYFEDGRQVWRFSKPGSAYTGKVSVDDRSQECVWEVEGDPAERND
jgi:hypothetical protein